MFPKDEPSSFFELTGSETSVPAPEPIFVPEDGRFDLYRIERDGKFRVIKCLKPKFRGDPLYEGLLKKEYQIGYPLQSSYICEVYAFLDLPMFGHCIEIEWIDGEPLNEYLSGGSASRESIRRIVEQLLEAVRYFHSKQVIHRDLKPSNILITRNGGNVKVIDFGFADTDSHSILKHPAGTRQFASPELLEGKKVDSRTDIYSTGVVLSMMGRRYRRISRRCCQRDPDKRFQTVSDVQKAIERNWHQPVLLLVALAVACIAAIFLLKPEKPDIHPVALPSVDTVLLTPAPVDTVLTLETPHKPSKAVLDRNRENPPATPSTPGPSEIDRIVKEATDLFSR